VKYRPVVQAVCIIFLTLAPACCVAQVDRAGLNGAVRDGAEARVPGAHIVALQPATGLHRETVSSSSGIYDIPELPIGVYRVICFAPGFKEAVFEGVELTVGHAQTLDIQLAVGGVAQQVLVSGQTSQLDETTATLGARTESEQVKELPLNGRNWSTLTALVPGAVDTGGSNQRSIRFAGRGLDDNNFTYDGIDATNIVNQAQQSFVRLAIPTDAIEEFRIDAMLFTAENGSTPGGQIDVASKSGSNTLHGGLFEFLRNYIFDAREPILRPGFHFVSTSLAVKSAAGSSATAASTSSPMKGLRQSYGQPLSGLRAQSGLRCSGGGRESGTGADHRRLSHDKADTLCHGHRSSLLARDGNWTTKTPRCCAWTSIFRRPTRPTFASTSMPQPAIFPPTV
jgi:hypothetical protein